MSVCSCACVAQLEQSALEIGSSFMRILGIHLGSASLVLATLPAESSHCLWRFISARDQGFVLIWGAGDA